MLQYAFSFRFFQYYYNGDSIASECADILNRVNAFRNFGVVIFETEIKFNAAIC